MDGPKQHILGRPKETILLRSSFFTYPSSYEKNDAMCLDLPLLEKKFLNHDSQYSKRGKLKQRVQKYLNFFLISHPGLFYPGQVHNILVKVYFQLSVWGQKVSNARFSPSYYTLAEHVTCAAAWALATQASAGSLESLQDYNLKMSLKSSLR